MKKIYISKYRDDKVFTFAASGICVDLRNTDKSHPKLVDDASAKKLLELYPDTIFEVVDKEVRKQDNDVLLKVIEKDNAKPAKRSASKK